MRQITVCNFKGGVGKSTTAIHLAGYFQTQGPTLLIDMDPNPTSLAWASRKKLPFQVVSDDEDIKKKRFETLIHDTSARPKKRSLKDIARDTDLFVVPTTPSALALQGTLHTIETLKDLEATYWVVFVNVPPKPAKDLEQARQVIQEHTHFVAPISIRRSSAYEKAATEGCLVRDLKAVRQRIYWSDFEALGRFLHEQMK
ncbi:ParA family protein [Deinococcus cellulosilyticus]|uniref:Chromosome partitioning protein ParA n=1 Tax=Deinococcus cellulosilyticus (strain DSM 18568 / NBRC 106333 / KACC 11606 / 5516J-15) TaxID=1223518 RepID=A0A511MVC3_DEIC1|nr:ParA family protein [Deinococcus cellulosilyticus]GEM44525.1 chromosome partitioning protein ParA [Deinococcus cellulosilyticus NBRC 106333 = KACC 11606]